jgi:hypothetical protein
MLLGTIHDHWDKSESVQVKKGDEYAIIRGKRIEIKLEENNHLRMSFVKTMNNRNEQYSEALSSRMNELECRRKDIAVNKKELRDIRYKLDNEELEEVVEEELEKQVRDKRTITKVHAREVKKLEAQKTVTVHYSVVKTGLTAILPPGLTLQPEFLSEPVCWCPKKMPASNMVDKKTLMVEEMPIIRTSAKHTTATGVGLKVSSQNEESKFVITAKGFDGQRNKVGGNTFVLESKEAEIKYKVLDKKNGQYEVSYLAGNVQEDDQFSLSVTLHGHPISGSPFFVSLPLPLFEFSSSQNHSEDWLDVAVATMSGIERAKLWVSLYDANGTEVYKGTGLSTSKWTQNHITAPPNVTTSGAQFWDDKHTNAIKLDNGDRMMIIGKQSNTKGWFGWKGAAFEPYNIIINAGWDVSKVSSYGHPRRMIITPSKSSNPKAPSRFVLDNTISFSSSAFTQTAKGNWPKFIGKFQVSYMPL